MIRRLWLGLAGGLLAGTGVGLVEALWVLSQAPTGEYVALAQAAVLYGLVGAGAGLVAGVLLALVGLAWRSLSDPLALSAAALLVVVGLGSWVLVFQLDRAVYLELGLGTQGQLVVAAVMLVVWVVGLWLLPIFLTRTPLKILLLPRGTLVAWAAVVFLAGLFALAPGPADAGLPIAPERPPPPDLGDTPDVVLVTVESWRLEALDPARSSELPGLARIAQRGIRFTQHLSSSSWRRPGLASLMTAQFPAAHGVDVVAARLEPDRLTLAELLRDRGYVTAALPARAELEVALGFDQGFDWLIGYGEPHDLARAESGRHLLLPGLARAAWRSARGTTVRREDLHRSASEVLDAARRFIQANRREGNRYLAWLHLAEPALPYFSADGREVAAARPGAEVSRAERERYLALYREELVEVDRVLGELVQWLEGEQALEDTLIVVVGVHGEELFEHGGLGSGDTLYDEQVRTPLVIALPGARHAGSEVPWQVRIIDVAPTILAETGTMAPEPWEGRGLLDGDTRAWLDDPTSERPPGRPALLQLHRRGALAEGLRAPPFKLVRANAGNRRDLAPLALFDLEQDPVEQRNLVGQLGATEAALSRALREQYAQSATWRTRPAVPRP